MFIATLVHSIQDMEATKSPPTINEVYTCNVLSSLKKEGNPAICDNMDKLRGHCDNCHKPVTEGHIPYDSTYTGDVR